MALSDILSPSYVEVGKIKIGSLGDERTAKSGSKWRPPVKLDHFVITTLHRDEHGLLIPDRPLMDSLRGHADPDGRLRALPVMFAANDPDELMTCHYVWYAGKQLGARSDGRTLTYFCDPKTGERLAEPRVLKWHPEMAQEPDPRARGKRLFRLYSTLNVMIASGMAHWGGFYRFRTTSEISARQLYGSLVHLRRLTGGVLRGLVFRMVVRPMLVTPAGQATTVYVVHVEYVNSDLQQLQAAAHRCLEAEVKTAEAVRQLEAAHRQLVAHQADEPDDDLIATEEPKALPAAGKSAEELLGDELDAAADLPALAQLWDACRTEHREKRVDDHAFARLARRKDARKAALAPKAGPTPVPAPAPDPDRGDGVERFDETEPAPDGAPEPDGASETTTGRAGAAILAKVQECLTALGAAWADVRAEHAEAIGFQAYRMKDLSPDQAARLLEVLRAEAAKAKAAGREPAPVGAE